jgi:hypothetical protein
MPAGFPRKPKLAAAWCIETTLPYGVSCSP